MVITAIDEMEDGEQLKIYQNEDLCKICHTQLQEPFIRCAECIHMRICANCFAQGKESDQHLSWHAYSIVSDRFPLILESWLACEERQLLELVIECGYGNWDDIGRRLARNPEECRQHYDAMYLEEPAVDELQDIALPPPPFQPTPLPPHLVRINCENPPRNCAGLSCYNALRSEFDEERDGNVAEKDLALVSMTPDDLTSPRDDSNGEDSQLLEDLQAAMAFIYNDRLRERARRHKVLRQHGLVLARKNYAAMSRFTATLGRGSVESLAPFMQLLDGPQFDFLLEGLHVAQELNMRYNRLSQLRACGVKSMQSAYLMKKLSHMRAESRRDLRAGHLAMPTPVRVETGRGGTRRQAPPLQVAGLPLYDQLKPEERELCAQARLVPENFIEFRDLLTAECRKQNGIRLAHARRCIKIDVNKTRKLFDFLMKQGAIFPPQD